MQHTEENAKLYSSWQYKWIMCPNLPVSWWPLRKQYICTKLKKNKNITRKRVTVLIGVIYSPWLPWKQVDLLPFGMGVGDGVGMCVCVCVCVWSGYLNHLKAICVVLCPAYCSHVHTTVLSILYLHCFTYLCKPTYCHIHAYTVHTLFILYMII